jgi:hypothetical protein
MGDVGSEMWGESDSGGCCGRVDNSDRVRSYSGANLMMSAVVECNAPTTGGVSVTVMGRHMSLSPHILTLLGSVSASNVTNTGASTVTVVGSGKSVGSAGPGSRQASESHGAGW